MAFRNVLPIVASLVLFGAPLAAQDEAIVTETKQQDPKPADPAKALREELAKIEAELKFIRGLNQKGGLLTRIRPTLTDRTLKTRSVDLGVAAPEIVAQPQEVAAPSNVGKRLMSDAERADAEDDTIVLVNGEPVSKVEFNELMAYYKSYPRSETEEFIKKQTMRALIMQKAAASQFKATSAATRKRLEELQAKLNAGADFAQLAREHSDCPSSASGGDLGVFGRGQMDAQFERAAYSLKVGETSAIIQSAFGYHLVKVTGEKKGESKDKDRVKASHILAMFDKDQQAVRKVMMDAINGQVDAAFVSDEWMKFAPPGF